MTQDAPPEDVFNILVATDNHLGYNEDDPITGDDSFTTFEEILQIAKENDVDFILLGGDLFHIAKPTADSIHRCMSMLREYCMGDRPVSFEVLSDQKENFANTTQDVVNYEDPNLNVSMPVFSIHGNHDDPTGQNMLCSLDIMSCAGLVNYFGKCVDLKKVPVTPLILRKGQSHLALYGFGHVKDQRLVRLFSEDNVLFYKPEEEQGVDWFNILVLHQNRADRGVKSYLPEEELPGIFDLVIWGHEHPCRIDPEYNNSRQFYVMQPGSSVATSLSVGESIQKKVAIVQVHKTNFNCTAIPLKTVRPFVYSEICSSEIDADEGDMRTSSEQLEALAEQTVNKMIKEARKKLTGHPKQPKLPLIRLVCFYADECQMFNSVRFGQKFEELVANPTNILLLKKRSLEKKEIRDVLETAAMDRLLGRADMWDFKVEDYIKKYFRDQELNDDEKYRMNVLTVAGLNEAVTQMVEKGNNSALDEIVKYQSSRMRNHLMTKDLVDGYIGDEMRNFNMDRKEAEDAETQETRSQLERSEKRKGPKPSTNGGGRASTADFDDNDEDGIDVDAENGDDDVEMAEEPIRGRGRGRGRGSRGPRAARAPRAPRAPRGSRAASSSTSTRGRGRGTSQPTLQQSLANASQISVVRTSARSTANRSRMQFVDSDDD